MFRVGQEVKATVQKTPFGEVIIYATNYVPIKVDLSGHPPKVADAIAEGLLELYERHIIKRKAVKAKTLEPADR